MPTSTTNQWKLGLFVVSSLVALIMVVVWMASRRFQRETMTVYTYFDEPVTGLEIGSPVRFRGMTIGSIADMRVAPDRHDIEVAAAVDVTQLARIGLREGGATGKDAIIPPTLRAVIERSFVTGVAFLQVDFYDPARHPPPNYPFPVPAMVVHAVPSSQRNLQQALDALLDSVPRLLGHITELVDALQQNIAAADVPALSRQATKTLADIDAAVAEIQWRDLDSETRALLAEARDAVATTHSTIDELRAKDGLLMRAGAVLASVEDQVAGADLPATTAALRRLLDGYGSLTPAAASLLASLQRATQSFRRLADLLERDPGMLLRGRAQPDDPRKGR